MPHFWETEMWLGKSVSGSCLGWLVRAGQGRLGQTRVLRVQAQRRGVIRQAGTSGCGGQSRFRGHTGFIFISRGNLPWRRPGTHWSVISLFCRFRTETHAASKAIHQAQPWLRRCGIVWQDVLPVSMYCKATKALLNTAVLRSLAESCHRGYLCWKCW